MAKVLIIYHSVTGNTEKMAEFVREGAKEKTADVEMKKAEEAKVEDLLEADAIVVGSPTYYGLLSAPLKKLFDDSVKYHGKLEGKVGGAFTSSANVGGGNETTILSILEAFLIHGMIIRGSSSGDHYGPVSVGAPGERVEKECRGYGRRMAELAGKIRG